MTAWLKNHWKGAAIAVALIIAADVALVAAVAQDVRHDAAECRTEQCKWG